MTEEAAPPRLRLDGVALVTGGSMGIGRAIATELVRRGMRVAVSARDARALEVAAAEIHALAVPGDVTDADDARRMVDTAEERLGPLELVVNNAGINNFGLLHESDPERSWETITSSLRGSLLVSRAALPGMVSRGRGRVVNVCSNSALSPRGGAYGVAKAALLRFTDTLAAELEGKGVKVFGVSPGMVRTRITSGRPELEALPASAWSPPERIGTLVADIASGRADSMNGRFIHVMDDLERMLAENERVRREELYQLRLHTLDGLR
jgi:NAD(P)-dependent dehydrogenase (short-subunit alcohol dehydrogenase family)